MQLKRSVSLSKTKYDGVQLYWKIKHTIENKDAPRITHIAWSNKNIAHWKMTWCFLLMKRGCLGHPQALTLVPLGYFLGWPWGHPQAWAFVHPSSYCIILLSLHLKTSFTQNSSQFFISNASAIKIIGSTWFSMTYQKHILNISYCSTT